VRKKHSEKSAAEGEQVEVCNKTINKEMKEESRAARREKNGPIEAR
jgi:hypothetical protein